MEITKYLFDTPVTLRADKIGDEYCVQLIGGTRPHIGCAVLAVPRPSLETVGKMSATVSVLNLTGIRTRKSAATLRRRSQRKQVP